MKVKPISNVYSGTGYYYSNKIESKVLSFSNKKEYPVIKEFGQMYIKDENGEKIYIGDDKDDSYFKSFNFIIIND